MRDARLYRWLTTVLIVGFLVAIAFAMHGLTLKVQHAESSADTAHAATQRTDRDNAVLSNAVSRLANQVRRTGHTPVVEPSSLPTARGETGPTGAAGAQGPGPSDSQVLAAVAQFCLAHGDCAGQQGAAGAAGAAGTNGKDSTVAGPQGSSGDRGPQGDTGPQGPQGAAGANAYPFTFTFSVPDSLGGSTTYTCIVSDPSATASCAQAAQ